MSEKQAPKEASGRYAYEGLDRILHEKARLSILVSLSTRPDGLLFPELRELCSLTDGNLSRHLEVLRESELIELWKGYSGKRPQTLVRLTVGGREKFLSYLAELQKVLQDARTDEAASKSTSKKGSSGPDLDYTFNSV